MCEKRVHCSLLRAEFALGDRVCQATDDCVHVGSVVKVHEGTGRYSVNFGGDEQANGRGGVQDVDAIDIRRLRPDDWKFVLAVAVRDNNEEEVLDLIRSKADPNSADQVRYLRVSCASRHHQCNNPANQSHHRHIFAGPRLQILRPLAPKRSGLQRQQLDGANAAREQSEH